MRLSALIMAALLACDDGAGLVRDASPSGRDAGTADARPDADARRLLHVEPDARRGDADGTRDRPFATVTDAYAESRPGDVVLLLAGEYEPPDVPPEGVSLLGVGPEHVRITGPVTLDRPGLVSGGFSVVGAGVVVTAATTLRDVHVLGAEGVGVDARADLTATDLRVIDSGGIGILLEGATFALERVDVQRAQGAGVRFVDAEGSLRQIRVARTAYSEAEATGSGVGFVSSKVSVEAAWILGGDRGVRVSMASDVRLEGLLVQDAHTGVNVSNESRADLRNVRVIGSGGGGLSVIDARVEIDGLLVRGASTHGVLASRAVLSATSVTVEDIQSRGFGLFHARGDVREIVVRRAGNVGVQITDASGEVTVEGALVEDCGTTGLSVLGDSQGPVMIRDLEVRGTRIGESGLAPGVHVFDAGAGFEGLRSMDNAGPGLLAERSTVAVSGALLTGNGGPGMVVAEGTLTAVVRDCVAMNNTGAGLLFVSSIADVTDCEASGSTPRLGEGEGDGVAAGFNSRLTLRGGRLHGNAGSGLSVSLFSEAQMSDARLEGNGRFGAYVACDGSTLEEPAANAYADNAEGDRNRCE